MEQSEICQGEIDEMTSFVVTHNMCNCLQNTVSEYCSTCKKKFCSTCVKQCSCGDHVCENCELVCQGVDCEAICPGCTKQCFKMGLYCDNDPVCYDHGYLCDDCGSITSDECLIELGSCKTCESLLTCSACKKCAHGCNSSSNIFLINQQNSQADLQCSLEQWDQNLKINWQKRKTNALEAKNSKKSKRQKNKQESKKADRSKTTKKTKRVQVPQPLRAMVWERDHGNFLKTMCTICNHYEISAFHFDAGHIISVANGGTNDIENLRAICHPCNQSMGSENMNVFQAKFKKIDDTL